MNKTGGFLYNIRAIFPPTQWKEWALKLWNDRGTTKYHKSGTYDYIPVLLKPFDMFVWETEI